MRCDTGRKLKLPVSIFLREYTSTGSLLRTTHTVGPIRVCFSDQPASFMAAAKLLGASCQRYRNILPGGTLMSHVAGSSGEAFLPHKNVTAHAGAFTLSQNRVTFIFAGAPPHRTATFARGR